MTGLPPSLYVTLTTAASAASTCGSDGHRAFPPAAACQLASLTSTLLLKLLRPSLSEKKQPKELVLLHHHLTDPLTGVRPLPTDNAYYQPLEINSAPSSAPSALQDLLTHPRPPPPPSNEPQTPLPQLEVPPIFSAVYHNLATYN